MLKLRDDVQAARLCELGFKPKYDENTGKIIAYVKIGEESEYIGLTVILTRIISRIKLFNVTFGNSTGWVVDKYDEYFDIDTLYDLIQLGWIEKTDRKIKEK